MQMRSYLGKARPLQPGQTKDEKDHSGTRPEAFDPTPTPKMLHLLCARRGALTRRVPDPRKDGDFIPGGHNEVAQADAAPGSSGRQRQEPQRQKGKLRTVQKDLGMIAKRNRGGPTGNTQMGDTTICNLKARQIAQELWPKMGTFSHGVV